MSNRVDQPNKRYEVVQMQFEWWVKDRLQRRFIATCIVKADAETISFVLNEFEKAKAEYDHPPHQSRYKKIKTNDLSNRNGNNRP